MSMNYRLATLLATIVVLTSACSSKYLPKLDEVLPDRTKDYRKSESLPDLEVPPDLSATAIQDTMNVPDIDESGTATFSTYQDRIQARQEAKRLENTSVLALSDEYLLILPGDVDSNWGRLQDFWDDKGFTLDLNDREYGVMETRWVQNNINFTRNRYKVFVEPGDQPATTAVYLSHSGQEQVPSGEELVWRDRPRDEALEKAMAENMSEYFGGAMTPGEYRAPIVQPVTPLDSTAAAAPAQQTAAVAPTASGALSEVVNAGAGKYYLALQQSFNDAWFSTGKALQALGVAVTGEDKARGIYDIELEETEEGGLLSKMAFWSDGETELQISLTGVGQKTELVVLDDDGKWAETEQANVLLDRLNRHFNAN